MALGAIFTDEDKEIKEEIRWSRNGPNDPLAAEAITVKLAVDHASKRGYRRITIYSDNQTIVDLLNHRSDDKVRTCIQMMTHSIRKKNHHFSHMKFYHINRSNSVKTHNTACAAADLGHERNVLGNIAQLVYHHVNNFV